jgi:hypothetical protein
MAGDIEYRTRREKEGADYWWRRRRKTRRKRE